MSPQIFPIQRTKVELSEDHFYLSSFPLPPAVLTIFSFITVNLTHPQTEELENRRHFSKIVWAMIVTHSSTGKITKNNICRFDNVF